MVSGSLELLGLLSRRRQAPRTFNQADRPRSRFEPIRSEQ